MYDLKEIRTQKGFTQESLAKALNITLRHYINIEQGKSLPNILTGLLISKLLKVNPYKLWLN